MTKKHKDIKNFRGFKYVTLKKVPIIQTKHGEAYNINFSKIDKKIALEILKREVPLRGREIQFLRKCLGLSQRKLALILGLSNTGLSKWEAKLDERVSVMNEAALRVFFNEMYKLNKTIKFSEISQCGEAEEFEYKLAV